MNIIEVDLHIKSLLDNRLGLDNAAILEYQLEAFQKALNKYKIIKVCELCLKLFSFFIP